MQATSSTTRLVNPAVCPLCGKSNLCAMELEKATGLPQGPCWCTQASFSPEVLSRLPAVARGLACLCADCARGGPRKGD